MSSVKFFNIPPAGFEMKYVVILPRYESRWILSRKKGRSTYEIPGGHIEPGETAVQAAKRELFEETGVSDCTLTPVCIYTYDSAGYLFLADVHSLGELPDFEMEETKLFDALPDNLTYPHIQVALYDKVQSFISKQSAKDELWDLYDKNRKPVGKTHRRGDPVEDGLYHLTVLVLIKNSEGKYLITKRAPTKGYPNMWEFTGGSAIAGDDSLAAAIREAKEETGIDLVPENGRIIKSTILEHYICDVWEFSQEVDLNDIKLQEGETTDAKLASGAEITEMLKNKSFIPYVEIVEMFLK